MEKLRPLEQAYFDAKESQFGLFENKRKTLEIINAAIIWKNFEGRVNQFGAAKRKFTVVIPVEVAAILEERGWNVKRRPLERKDADGNILPPVVVDENGNAEVAYTIDINVNMESEWPPVIKRISRINGQRVDEEMNIATVKELDKDTFLDCSVEINERVNDRVGRATGYLRMLTVVTDPEDREADFGGRYDNYYQD